MASIRLVIYIKLNSQAYLIIITQKNETLMLCPVLITILGKVNLFSPE